MKTNVLVIMALIASMALLSLAIPYAHAVDVTSTATILPLCGVETVPLPTTIVYDSLAPYTESSDQPLQIVNPGNVQATVFVRGTDWSSVTLPTIPNVMLVSATHYSLTSGQSYDSKTALTGSDTQLTTLTALQQKTTLWQLRTTLNDATFVGPAKQVVTLTGSC
jgi:hypothetical protein